MTSRNAARSIRFTKLLRCLPVLAGMAIASCLSTTAHAQLNWKSPQVNSRQHVQKAYQPLQAPQRAPIQLVQYAEPIPYEPTLAPILAQNTPSANAILDTTHPETRPQSRQPSTAPLPGRVGVDIQPPPGMTSIPQGEPPINHTLMSDVMNNDYSNYGNMIITADQAGCPDPRVITKPMTEIGYDISMAIAREELPQECTINYGEFMPRNWRRTCFQFKAPCLCTKGAYFEDVDLERYGHSWGPFLQPVISGGKFFLTVPLLPYKMGLVPPNECVYTLGHYRPGSCAPYIIDPLPLSLRAGLLQAGAVVGAVYLIP